MRQTHLTAYSVALALAAPVQATANDSSELEKIRAEIQQMRASYEARIRSLEEKLQQADVTASRAEQSAQRAETAATQAAARPAAANSFNPETSVILDGKYVDRKEIDERHLSGFLPVAHAHGEDTRGFSLNHTELVFSANIDSWLRGYANLALLDDQVELEEAYFETLGLGYGLTVKGGRFRSGIGYQNEIHAHAWDFADNSLMYEALFGEAHIQEGVQLKWVAPTDLLVELGSEIGRGAEINHYNDNGAGTISLFAHVGGDIGASHSWRAGLSWLRAKVDQREFDAHDVTETEASGYFDGNSRIWIADFVYKWAPNGNATQTNFKLQGEYFQRKESGNLDCAAVDGGASACDAYIGASDYEARQTGWYLQGIYQFAPKWRAGLRHDQLDSGSAQWNGLDVGNALESLQDYDPRRTTAMLEFNPSEYSRFRLQYANDRSMQDLTDHQWTLQYIMTLGAHGAHKF